MDPVKKYILIIMLAMVGFQVEAKSPEYIACESKYALCTTAACDMIPGKKGIVSCHCSVQEGYSLGRKPCVKEEVINDEHIIKSRYYPIKSYAICANSRPWAWCLDSPCVIDKQDPSKADCKCLLVKNRGNYIMVTDSYNKDTCTTGLNSSATVKQARKAIDFLKTQQHLPVYQVKVLNQ